MLLFISNTPHRTHTNTHIIPPANTGSIPRAGSFIKIHRPFGKFSVCNKSTSMETLVDPPHGWGRHCANRRPVPSHWYVVIVVKCWFRASGFDFMEYLQANRRYDRKQTWRVWKFAAVAFTDERLWADKLFYRTTFTPLRNSTVFVYIEFCLLLKYVYTQWVIAPSVWPKCCDYVLKWRRCR